MKKILISLLMISMLLVSVGIVVAVKPTSFTVDFNQVQDQWRGKAAFGAWTDSYLTSATSAEFELTGNVLHTSWEYSPAVTDLEGGSTVYIYNKEIGLWIEKEGTVSYGYIPGYGNYPAVNYFRGYIDFDGKTPSQANFVKGVAYQWVYIYAPEDPVPSDGSYTVYAEWDETMGAWLVGFSVYRWDIDPPTTVLPFPSPFPEPVPANNYNPLGL